MDINTDEHLDPSNEMALSTVKSRAVKGVVFLTGRTFVFNVLSLVATGFLTVFLEPSEIGIFWIVTAVVNILVYFGDIGLAGALIQKKDKLEDNDLHTTFWVQQTLVILLLIILFLVSPKLATIYHLSSSGIYLVYALGISFFLSSLKTIPSVLMERELRFERLIIPQIVENLLYNLVIVYLAYKGWGITSYTIAVLVRGISGLIVTYLIRPWRPKLAFSFVSLKRLLSYGLPYQLNTFLAVAKDDGMTSVLGGILGGSAFSFLGWAQKWGQAPLRFFMDHIIKVTFPAYARMQNEKDHLRRSLERSIFFIVFLVFPSLLGLLAIAPILLAIIPRYQKWEPALVPLMFVAVNTMFAAVTTPLTNYLNAVGRIKTTFALMIMWTVLTWALVPIMAIKFGVNGAAMAYALVSISSVVAIYIVRRQINFSFNRSFVKPLFSSLLMFGCLLVARPFLPVSSQSVGILILGGVLVYLVSIYSLVGVEIANDVVRSVRSLLGRDKVVQ